VIPAIHREGTTVTIDPLLLEILACPSEHHAPVELDHEDPAQATALICTRCRSSFPIRDGIPVMLLDEATPGPLGFGVDVPPGTTSAGTPGTTRPDGISAEG